MNLTMVPRVLLICMLIFGFLIGVVPSTVAEPQNPFIEYFLLGYTVYQFGYILTPLNELEADISKLRQDELFVQRWMSLNNDPASLEKGQVHLSRIQNEKKAEEKKRNRIRLWFYPTIGVISTGAILLFGWLRGD
jgi:hypothetical protein